MALTYSSRQFPGSRFDRKLISCCHVWLPLVPHLLVHFCDMLVQGIGKEWRREGESAFVKSILEFWVCLIKNNVHFGADEVWEAIFLGGFWELSQLRFDGRGLVHSACLRQVHYVLRPDILNIPEGSWSCFVGGWNLVEVNDVLLGRACLFYSIFYAPSKS